MRDSVRTYLDEIGRVPLLSHEEERSLTRQYVEARTAAAAAEPSADAESHAQRAAAIRRKLIEANLRLVVRIAKGYPTSARLDLLDLIQAGNIGLGRAIDRFDPARGYRLSTYATVWIKQAISRTVDSEGSTIKFPEETSGELRRAMRTTDGDLGLLPSHLRLLERRYHLLSLDEVVMDDGPTRGELVRDERVVEDIALDRWDAEAIARAVDRLPEQSRVAIRLFYGLDGGQPRTCPQIAEQLKTSAVTVSSHLKRGRKLLREPLSTLAHST